jgi:membrane-associated phospholipid phosphatase
VGVVFFSVYPATNWLASLRTWHYVLFADWELGIPFIPQWIWAYLSMYLLFLMPPFFMRPPAMRRLAEILLRSTLIAGLLFLLIPAPIGFSRLLPETEPYRGMFALLFDLDRPYNTVPSLHVCYSAAIAAYLFREGGRTLRVIIPFWLFLIVCSTMLTHQHHVADVLAGLLLPWLVSRFWREKC